MGKVSKTQLENLFLKIDSRLKKEIELYIIGGASAILGYDVTKVTNDVDVDGNIDPELKIIFDEEAKSLGLDLYLSSRGVFFPPDDYRSRGFYSAPSKTSESRKVKIRVCYF